jgi:hypothetical protein
MALPTKTQHPLLNRAGASQRKRLDNAFALSPEYAPIDSRSLEDILDYIHQYARQVVFHEQKRNAAGNLYLELSNWLPFFEDSLPFRLVRFSKTDFNRLEQDLLSIAGHIETDPVPENLNLLLDFYFYEFITPIDALQRLVRRYEFDLNPYLENSIEASLLSPLMRYILLSNGAAIYLCIGKRQFSHFTQAPWSIPIEDLFSADKSIVNIPGGRTGAVLWLKEELVKLSLQTLGALRLIAREVPLHLEAALEALQGRHEPHLGLLYAFIRLFSHFQGDLNRLTREHLDFFYQNVLKIKPKGLQPDKAHLIFELAKHLETYPITQGRAFKDGKDKKGADIIFNLDEEIIIDKAQVKDLKTLYLNHSYDHNYKAFVEGVYIAPNANSADGKGEAFREEQSKNWATLGAKPSKFIAPGKDTPEDHPFGRIGFVLASPVLWLNEGRREITITIKCDKNGNLDISDVCFTTNGISLLENFFQVQLSGEDGWFTPKKPLEIELDINNSPIELTFTIKLDPDEPKVAFYDEEAIEEFFKLDCPYPMVKIELNPEIRLACDRGGQENPCCLQNDSPEDAMMVGLYHFFRHLKVVSTKIEVEVCGVKNLIVQNEESLQDVNSLILPFGARPKVKSAFFIGSNEVFCKNWTETYVNVIWKDKPEDFGDHYEDYVFGEPFEDDTNVIQNNSFNINFSLLNTKAWKHLTDKELFTAKDHAVFCLDNNNKPTFFSPDDETIANTYKLTRVKASPGSDKLCKEPELLPLTVNTLDGFIRLELRGVSFQHEKFPFVLARNLIKLAGLIDPKDLPDLIDQIKDIKNFIADAAIPSDTRYAGIRAELNHDFGIINLIDKVQSIVEEIIDEPGSDYDIQELEDILDLLAVIDFTNIGTTIQNAIDDSDVNFLIQESITQLNNVNLHIDKIRQILGFITPAAGEESIISKIDAVEILLLDIEILANSIQDKLNIVSGYLPSEDEIQNLRLPKEPYTPTIKSISLDYKAEAEINDITLIHLHPFENTSKTEVLSLQPTLLPTFTDEGTLFIGLEDLRPGANLHLLFQLAEATADSESDRAAVQWHYLTGNRWQPLRTGFELLADLTDRLTRSGILKIAVPHDISNIGNTLMPPTEDGKHLHWLKASAPQSVAAVAEVIGIHTQAAPATFQPLPGSDPNRVSLPLDPMKISKPLDPDFSIKKVEQPYESFGGQTPEAEGHLYTRVSEHLRHKGRGVDAFDMEHLVLEAFPQLFKCKCISHTLSLSANTHRRDLEVAPGFIIVAVVPDLTKLKAGDMLEPKAPISLLTDVKQFLKERVSPFTRIRVANPRYEKIKVEVKVRLMPGRDENYYAAQLKTDLIHFLAPWHLGDSDKLSLGQPVVFSDVIGFIENLAYIDFIADLKLYDSEGIERRTEVQPLTARSILTGGEICVHIDRDDCDKPVEIENPKRSIPILLRKPVFISLGEARPFRVDLQPLKP